MAKKNHSRHFLTICTILLIIGGLAFAFKPQPVLVDIGEVKTGKFVVTLDEEARTRVHDTYIVSTPIAGRLLRVEVEPGDIVKGGETIIARMLPMVSSALDARSHEQARATVAAAKAALRAAQANRNKALADKELADADLKRKKGLKDKEFVSDAAFEKAKREAQAAIAALDTAEANISMREAELANAQAVLIDVNAQGSVPSKNKKQQKEIAIKAPISGSILRVIQQSETTLPVGASIIEIGNVKNDLEVLAELLSTDAVQVKEGHQVIIDNWGGDKPLSGVVQRVDPWGYTKFSALGVEEQRVNTLIRLTDPPEERTSLGHGFRVEVRIIVWEDENATIIPASALFRQAGEWSVFVIENDIAQLCKVTIDRNNGLEASVIDGVKVGDKVVLYPSSALASGSRIARR